METPVIPSKTTVTVNVSNSQNDTVSFEKKFPKSLTVAELKSKLEIMTGGNAGTMHLELYSGEKFISKLDGNDSPLGSFPIEDGMRIHVIDNFVFDQNVPKFELTPDQYEQRQESLRSFLKSNKLGKYNEEEMKKLDEQKQQQAAAEQKLIDQAKVGLRCRVSTKGKPTRLGTIRFNGQLDGKKGTFIGVQFDEPLGNNDGSVEGKRYFECPPKYGSFVAPTAVEVGDFPPEEFELDDEI